MILFAAPTVPFAYQPNNHRLLSCLSMDRARVYSGRYRRLENVRATLDAARRPHQFRILRRHGVGTIYPMVIDRHHPLLRWRLPPFAKRTLIKRHGRPSSPRNHLNDARCATALRSFPADRKSFPAGWHYHVFLWRPPKAENADSTCLTRTVEQRKQRERSEFLYNSHWWGERPREP